MVKIAVACLAAAMLCAGCLLTKEDLDCWYDDMCLAGDNGAAPAQPFPPQSAAPPLAGR